MNPQDRIHELTTRQVFFGSPMVCKLNAVNGKWFYKVYAWINQTNIDNKTLVLQGKYNGEDPDDLFSLALLEIGCKKIKVGNLVNKDSFVSERVN